MLSGTLTGLISGIAFISNGRASTCRQRSSIKFVAPATSSTARWSFTHPPLSSHLISQQDPIPKRSYHHENLSERLSNHVGAESLSTNLFTDLPSPSTYKPTPPPFFNSSILYLNEVPFFRDNHQNIGYIVVTTRSVYFRHIVKNPNRCKWLPPYCHPIN